MKFKMAVGAAFKQSGSAWSSGIKDYTSKLLTGKESSSHNASSLHVGVGDYENFDGTTKQNANKDGTVGYKSIEEVYNKQSKQAVEADNVKNKGNNPTPDNSEHEAGKVSINGSEQKSDLG